MVLFSNKLVAGSATVHSQCVACTNSSSRKLPLGHLSAEEAISIHIRRTGQQHSQFACVVGVVRARVWVCGRVYCVRDYVHTNLSSFVVLCI